MFNSNILKFTNLQLAQLATNKEEFKSICELLYDNNETECYSDIMEEIARRWIEYVQEAEYDYNETRSKISADQDKWPDLALVVNNF